MHWTKLQIGQTHLNCVFGRNVLTIFLLYFLMLALPSLKGHTRGEENDSAFFKNARNFELNFDKCILIATDKTTNMTTQNIGFLTLLQNSHFKNKSFLDLHCIIHLESLFAKFGLNELQNIISYVTVIINYTKGRPLLHREFLSFANEKNEEETDILYYTEVRWLSEVNMSDRCYK